jgi:hypothetical protein
MDRIARQERGGTPGGERVGDEPDTELCSQTMTKPVAARAGEDAATTHCRCPRFRIIITLALLLVVHAGLLGLGAWQHSPSWDEVGQLPAGLSHWQMGLFDLYRVNPPLVRAVAALPVLFLNPKTHWDGYQADPWIRPESRIGCQFVQSNGECCFRYFAIARCVCIPFGLLGACVCFSWARDLYGNTAGLFAAALWCFSPNVLAHAQMMTPDAGATAIGIAAGYTFWRWLRQPGWPRAVLAGVVMGLAELGKTTWIVLFLVWPTIWLAWVFGARRRATPRIPRKDVIQLLAVVLLSVYIINLGYAFEGSCSRLGDFSFVSAALTRNPEHADRATSGNRFAGTWLGTMRVPLPKNFVQGIDVQKRDFEKGQWSFLRGEWRYGGWWYYYLYALAIKVPLGTWTLMGLCGAASVLWPGYASSWRNELVVLTPAIVVLTLVSS